MSKTASYFKFKFLAIMKILLPGRLYTIFTSLFPLFKLLYRYGKNIHSIIGLLFLANLLDFSLNLGIIFNNLIKVYNIAFNLFNNILERFTNLTISKKVKDIYPIDKPNHIENSNIIEKSNNKINEFKKTYSNDINNQESLREFYKHDLENKTFWEKHKWNIIIGVSIIISIGITYYYWDYFSGYFPKKPDTKLNDQETLSQSVNSSNDIYLKDTRVPSTDKTISPSSSTGSITPTNNNNKPTSSTPNIDYKDPWAYESSRNPGTQAEYEKYFTKPKEIK